MKEKSRAGRVYSYWSKPNHAAYLFIAPSLAVILVFVVFPLVSSFVISLTDMDIFMKDTKLIGFGN